MPLLLSIHSATITRLTKDGRPFGERLLLSFDRFVAGDQSQPEPETPQRRHRTWVKLVRTTPHDPVVIEVPLGSELVAFGAIRHLKLACGSVITAEEARDRARAGEFGFELIGPVRGAAGR